MRFISESTSVTETFNRVPSVRFGLPAPIADRAIIVEISDS